MGDDEMPFVAWKTIEVDLVAGWDMKIRAPPLPPGGQLEANWRPSCSSQLCSRRPALKFVHKKAAMPVQREAVLEC